MTKTKTGTTRVRCINGEVVHFEEQVEGALAERVAAECRQKYDDDGNIVEIDGGPSWAYRGRGGWRPKGQRGLGADEKADLGDGLRQLFALLYDGDNSAQQRDEVAALRDHLMGMVGVDVDEEYLNDGRNKVAAVKATLRHRAHEQPDKDCTYCRDAQRDDADPAPARKPEEPGDPLHVTSATCRLIAGGTR